MESSIVVKNYMHGSKPEVGFVQLLYGVELWREKRYSKWAITLIK